MYGRRCRHAASLTTVLHFRKSAALFWLASLLSGLWHPGYGNTTFSTKISRTELQKKREEEGLNVPLTIGLDDFVDGLSTADKLTCDRIRGALDRNDWYAAQHAFDTSEKTSAPVFNMLMVAALKLGNFEKGVKIYEDLGHRGVEKTLKSYCCAIRLFSQLERKDETMKVWNEARAANLWNDSESANSLMCAALHAAAQFADHGFATQLLDMMQDRGKILNVLDYNQALDACKNSLQHEAAMHLYSEMVRVNVTPNVITFALLVGAHSGKPLKDITDVASQMALYDIEPNVPFLEELVSAMIGARRQGLKITDLQQARMVASQSPASHLRAAQRVIEQIESQGVELSQLLRRFKAAMSWALENSGASET
ncbi:unnamed protein product [Symbiodinium sp. CCMP2456]|nr:unnamed protein product [Symbiodinium sp. CCMP2456]